MRTKLLTPGWVVAHVLVAIFVVSCGWLGWWQWQRAESTTGTLQNLGYALQWPLFGVAAIYMLRRAIRMESQRAATEGETAPAADGQRQPISPEPASQPPPSRVRATPTQPAEVDDELAAYNRYLAQLHERDQRRAG
jgi:DNA-binding transcriptional regulator of glucitol operon